MRENKEERAFWLMQELESEFDQEDQISVDYSEEEKEDEVDDQMDNVTVF